MNLELLNNGVAGDKPWLNPVCNNLSALNIVALGSITAAEFIGPEDAATVTLVNQSVAPAAPAAGSTVIYSNSSSNVLTKNSASTISNYVSTPVTTYAVNDIAVFSATDGSKLADGGFGLLNLIRNQVTMKLPGPTLTNSAAFTSLLNAGQLAGAGLTIPANQLAFGSSINFSTNINVGSSILSSTLTLVAALNGTAIDSVTLTLGVQTNINFKWDFTWLYQAVNEGITYGVLYSDIATPLITEGTTSSFNPAVAQVISFGAQWNTASASNSVNANTFYVTRNL